MRGNISEERYIDIKKDVIFMFQETNTHTIPINPFAIAKELSYVVIPYSDLTSIEKTIALAKSADAYSKVIFNPTIGLYQYVIFYNDDITNICRIRWTLLHEIGHIYLGHHDNPDDSLYKLEEKEANFFAKYASAAPPLINIFSCSNAFEIAERFGISYEAASYNYNYYLKWKKYGPANYTDYERELIEQFRIA